MKDYINRLRQFAKEHTTTVIYASGVATGAAVTTYVVAKYPQVMWRELNVFVTDSPEELIEKIRESGGFRIFNPSTGQSVQIGVIPVLEQLNL